MYRIPYTQYMNEQLFSHSRMMDVPFSKHSYQIQHIATICIILRAKWLFRFFPYCIFLVPTFQFNFCTFHIRQFPRVVILNYAQQRSFSTYVLMRPNCTILESKYPGWSTKNSTPLTTRNRVVCEFFCVLTNQIEQQQNGENFWILFYVLYSQFIDYWSESTRDFLLL